MGDQQENRQQQHPFIKRMLEKLERGSSPTETSTKPDPERLKGIVGGDDLLHV